MKKTIDATSEQFFYKRLRELFEDWQRRERAEGRRGSQQEFAKRIVERRPDARCDYRAVSKWLNGKSYPETYIMDIADVLGVKVEDLFPSTHDEQYASSSFFMNAFKDNEILPYCEEIGLDESFVKAIRGIVDFEKLFPLFTPLMINPNFREIVDGRYYQPAPEYFLADSAPMEDGTFQVNRTFNSLYGKSGQIEPMDSLITMSRADLLFLRDVQKEVAKYIEFLFMKRRDEMKEEVEKINKASERRLTDGGVAHIKLTSKQICEISPYYKAFVDTYDDH